MRRLKKPIREVVETLLKYEFGDRNVFRLVGNIIKPGDNISTIEGASLDKPSSLEMPKYKIIYTYIIEEGRIGTIYIAKIKKNYDKPEETLFSIPTLFGNAEKIEDGLHMFEDALEGM